MTDQELRQETAKKYPYGEFMAYRRIDDIREAYIAGVKSEAAKLWHAPKWIPVSEQLPDQAKCVLVVSKGENNPKIATYASNEHWYLYRDCFNAERIFAIILPNITHWMELPTINTKDN